MLSIQQLKAEAYMDWETLLFERGAYNLFPMSFDVSEAEAERFPYTHPDFRSEVRKRFGDLRRRDTWESAAISLAAQSTAQSFLEAYQILAFIVSPGYMNSLIREHYGDRLIEYMLAYPEIIDLIRRGLEQIYRDDCAKERELVERFIAEGNRLPGIETVSAPQKKLKTISSY